MFAVIFEVEPHPEHKQSYLDIAGSLKSELETIDGFISVERFQSLVNPEKLLSLSFWRDEAAIKSWRETVNHRNAQEQGRSDLFAAYRIRVAEVARDYGKDSSPWR